MDASAFSRQETDQILAHGITLEDALHQLALYRDPSCYSRLVRPCADGDGVRVLGDAEAERCLRSFARAAPAKTIVKFVPASGAASRMFKLPLHYLGEGGPITSSRLEHDGAGEMLEVVSRIDSFAFYGALTAVMEAAGLDASPAAALEDARPLLSYLLTAQGLDYSALPKALLEFHRYGSTSRTAFEEHLVEAAAYAQSADGCCRLHFTVSHEHRPLFEQLAWRVVGGYREAQGVSYQIEYSTQKPSTDVMAVDMSNRPFLSDDGQILFRPGGHGALIENLGELDADVVFIKNIDNVVPDHLRGPTYHWKRVLAGLLLELQEKVFAHLAVLEGDDCGAEAVETALAFLSNEIGVAPPPAAASAEQRRAAAIELLDRPLRVCGMVRNTGEPGGGPFWVDKDGTVSAQIVESSQVDPDDAGQQSVLGSSTHFNPVDLVCTLRDRRGRRYSLQRYIDADAVFIAEKSKDGRPLRSLERPGLWNGAMAGWNSVFVEVPIETFNPVKTINDLLRPSHQPPA